MRVLIIPSWYPNDPNDLSGSFFREQAIALLNAGCDVTVIDAGLLSTKLLFSMPKLRFSEYTDEGIKVFRYKRISFGRGRFSKLHLRLFRYNVRRLIKKTGLQFDVIHAHSFFPAGIVACEIGEKTQIPIVITEHSSSVISKKLTGFQVDKLKKVLEDCAKFISVSNGLEKAVCDYCGNSEKFVVIPNMVSNIFYPDFEVHGHNDFVFTFIGNLNENKRILVTLKSFHEAYRNDNSLRLNIIGDGPERENLQRYVKDNNLYGAVRLLGSISRENVANELRKSDAFVLASAHESFGVAYIEALSCGLPIIATRNGGGQDIVNEKNGILIAVDDSDSLVEALKEMKKKIGNYSKIDLYEQTQKKYSEFSIVNQIMTVYEDVIKEYDRN